MSFSVVCLSYVYMLLSIRATRNHCYCHWLLGQKKRRFVLASRAHSFKNCCFSALVFFFNIFPNSLFFFIEWSAIFIDTLDFVAFFVLNGFLVHKIQPVYQVTAHAQKVSSKLPKTRTASTPISTVSHEKKPKKTNRIRLAKKMKKKKKKNRIALRVLGWRKLRQTFFFFWPYWP